MSYFLSLLTGILISVMVAINGVLTERLGVYTATIVIHSVGFAVIAGIMLARRERLFARRQAFVLYLGGAVGVFTTVFNNLAFESISVSAIVGLGLFGQSVTGIFIDHYGWMGMPKHPFNKMKLVGFALILCGIIAMTDRFELMAVAASLATGITVVVSRTINAKLADVTSMQVSTFFNYAVGLICAVPLYLLFGGGERLDASVEPNWYIYVGGAIGVLVIWLSNVVTMKISAFYLSLLLFIGQVFSGILIDAFIAQAFSMRNLLGGLLVAAGLLVNLGWERKGKKRARCS